MFYNKINNPKIKIYRVILNCFLIMVYLINFSSCMTTGLYNVSPDSLEPGPTADIKKIELKNGSVIDCSGKLIRIDREPDSSLVYVILSDEPVKAKSGGDQKEVNWSKVRIPEKEIKALTLEKSVSDPAMTGLAVGGGVLMIAIIVLIAAASSMNFGFGH